MSYAQITIVGRLGRDPEVKIVGNGKELVTASVAVGKDDKTIWYRVACWEKTGMWLKDAAKGDMVFVQGSLEIKTYEKKTGGTAIDAQVNAQVIRAMTQKKEEATPFHGQQRAQVPAQFDDTDLPF
jgi:single-strand DNA-binding protein